MWPCSSYCVFVFLFFLLNRETCCISASLLLDADVVGQYSSVVSNCVIDVYQMDSLQVKRY